MRFSLATIATAALIFSASAAPHRGHGRGRNSTDTDGQGGKGAGRGRFSDGTYPSGAFGSRGTAAPTGFPGFSGKPSGPALTAVPTALPTGGADLSTVSFELPSSAANYFGTKRAESDDEESSDSSDSSDSSEDTQDEEESSSDEEETSSGDESTSDDSSSGDEETSSGSGEEETGDEESSSGSGGSSSGGSSGGSSNSTAPSTPSSGGSTASGTFPTAAGESTLSAPMEVTDFDGGLVRFGRGVSCSSGEGGDSDAVFIVADGGSLSNVIIGADQIEGVHCLGACTITNVWWEAVCEDALSFKGNGDGTVSGGGAKAAKDKVVQHNGVGTISISGFYVEDFGKLYRSCGNCKTVSHLSLSPLSFPIPFSSKKQLVI